MDNPEVQSDKPVRGRTTRGDRAGEQSTPAEVERMARGQELKRYVRSAAALCGLYDDTALGKAVGRTRIAVGKWWQGAQPEAPTLIALARVTGLSAEELIQFVYNDGPPPSIAWPGSAIDSAVREGIRRDRQRQHGGDPEAPAPSPAPPPRGTGAGREL